MASALFASTSTSGSKRAPAVAGQFYPAQTKQLRSTVRQMFELAKEVDKQSAAIKALIVPHAGLVYSGPIAASAYQCLRSQAETIKRVVLLGPSHRVGFHGIATTGACVYTMPFGDVSVDRAAIDLISPLQQVVALDQAHQFEHSLEVQLPFLQTILDDFVLVPLVVGECRVEQVAEVVDRLWGNDETLIVVSSDLSHFLTDERAKVQDRKTADAIVSFAVDDIHDDDACGHHPLRGFLIAARRHDLQPTLLDLRNSADTAGTPDRVVGYGAFAFRQ